MALAQFGLDAIAESQMLGAPLTSFAQEERDEDEDEDEGTDDRADHSPSDGTPVQSPPTECRARRKQCRRHGARSSHRSTTVILTPIAVRWIEREEMSSRSITFWADAQQAPSHAPMRVAGPSQRSRGGCAGNHCSASSSAAAVPTNPPCALSAASTSRHHRRNRKHQHPNAEWKKKSRFETEGSDRL